MNVLPDPDECRIRLLFSGWSVTENGTYSAWIVFGTHGHHYIETPAGDRNEAWHLTYQKAARGSPGLIEHLQKESSCHSQPEW